MATSDTPPEIINQGPWPPEYVPDKLYDLVMDDERSKLDSARQCLEEAYWHASNVSDDTWPKALHVIPGAEGEDIDVLIKDKVISGTKCIQVVANVRSIDVVSLTDVVEAHDFIFSDSLGWIACKTTLNNNSTGDWNHQTFRGPIIHRADYPRAVAGPSYIEPRLIKHVPKGRELTIFGVMKTIAATQLLTTWLSILTTDTYQANLSRNI